MMIEFNIHIEKCDDVHINDMIDLMVETKK